MRAARPSVGFLTLLERLHCCTVGWRLERPRRPVRLLASETHLTVLFSPSGRLTAPPSAWQRARRAYGALDRGRGDFSLTSRLAELTASYDLVTEQEYVELRGRQLDPDQLGIVLRIPLLGEFSPKTAAERPPDAFTVYHYSGLMRSNPDGKVKLVKGDACLLETDARSSPAGRPRDPHRPAEPVAEDRRLLARCRSINQLTARTAGSPFRGGHLVESFSDWFAVRTLAGASLAVTRCRVCDSMLTHCLAGEGGRGEADHTQSPDVMCYAVS